MDKQISPILEDKSIQVNTSKDILLETRLKELTETIEKIIDTKMVSDKIVRNDTTNDHNNSKHDSLGTLMTYFQLQVKTCP